MRKVQRRREAFFALGGGLNLVDPPIKIPPGMLLAGMNYETRVRGGYRRILGFERYDGQAAPSDASYYVLNLSSITGAITTGDTITGATSGATGVALIDHVVTSGTDGYIVFTKLTGNFTDTENIQVSAVTQAVANGTETADAASSTTDHYDWRFLAAENYRADIAVVPGSGQIRGVHVYNGSVYAFRDNSGGTAVDMYKATAAGWVLQSLGNIIYFSSGTTEFAEGETLTGGTSGATATINRVVLQSGAWDGSGAGYLIIGTVTSSPYQAAEALTSASGSATAVGAEAANTLPAGGTYEFINHNFYGHTKTIRAYGVNGQGPAFEWDGTVFCPIYTGMTTDTPNHIEAHANHLFLAFPGGSLQNSSQGQPTVWSPVTGAAEIALGEEITGIKEIVYEAMAVVGRNRTFILYGTDSSTWSLKPLSRTTGAIEWSLQKLGQIRYADDRGVTDLTAVQDYGNFKESTISHMVQPLYDSKKSLICASTVVRDKNQYRVFFTDGTGVIMTFNSNKLVGITQFDYGMAVRVITSLEDSSGNEVIYFGSDDGYIYQAEKGTSLDGSVITAWLILPYYHYGTPAVKKQFRKLTPEFDADPAATIYIQPDYAYGDPDIPASEQLDILGGGGTWNVDNWGQFLWSAQVVSTGHLNINGQGENMGIYFYSNTDREDVHSFHGVTTQYSIRGIER